jgi:SnoaL-like domain
MKASEHDEKRIGAVREFYVRGDAWRDDLLDLFTEDFEFYFPKFGVARGKEAFGRFAAGLLASLKSIEHFRDRLVITVCGDQVFVEGTTHGTTLDGTEWSGGRTAGGRFASVFHFRGHLIDRMYIYLDPDYGSHDRARFLWADRKDQRW